MNCPGCSAVPAEALARISKRLRSLKPKEAAELVLGLTAYRHPDGTLDVRARVDLDELYTATVQLPLEGA